MLHLLFNTPSAFRISSWLSQLGETAFGPSKMTPKNKRLRPFLSRQGLPLAGRQLSVIFSYYVHSKKGSGRSLVKSKEVLTCSVWAVVRVIRPCFLRGAQNICVCCGWNPQSLNPSNFGVYSWATQTPAVSERYDEVCMFDHFWTISCFLRLPGAPLPQIDSMYGWTSK